MSIWREELDFDQELYDNIDTFFEQLQGSKELEYRESQHTMALDIMDTIKKKEILLIEAGVGSGKSWGYLVPIIYASLDKKNFKGFLISTSSIALEEQLKSEIEKLSNMLAIEIDVTVAKGKNNFLCQKRLQSFLKYNHSGNQYNTVIQKVEAGKVDRKDFNEITQKVWKRINVDKVRCTDCIYNYDCKYILQRKNWATSKAVICNHDLLVEILKRDSQDKLFEDPSILVVDEAHNLEEKIRNSYQKTLTKKSIESLIYCLYGQMEETIDDDMPLLNCINKVFWMISNKAKREYKSNALKEIDVLNSESSGFSCTPAMKKEVEKLINYFESLENYANQYPRMDYKLLEQINQLKEVKEVFSDLIAPTSKNIYWAEFMPKTNEHIKLYYVQKNIPEIANQLLSNPQYGKVFTSATLTTDKNDYSYFMQGLGLNKILSIAVEQEYSQPSPYDYDNNALLYCATDVISPKSKDHDLYLDSLTSKIEQLLQISHGRSLVLFTSKNDRNEVYSRLQEKGHDFELLLQKDGEDTEALKERFKEDESSTLLATGSFWQGIDIKGSSLESVIITKLPFPVVTPIIEEKAAIYKNGFEAVYLKEMLLMLKQGAGRLIRSDTDKGIVSILDSRVKDYIKPITNCLPFTNITKDITEVESFATTLHRNDSKQTGPVLRKGNTK